MSRVESCRVVKHVKGAAVERTCPRVTSIVQEVTILLSFAIELWCTAAGP